MSAIVPRRNSDDLRRECFANNAGFGVSIVKAFAVYVIHTGGALAASGILPKMIQHAWCADDPMLYAPSVDAIPAMRIIANMVKNVAKNSLRKLGVGGRNRIVIAKEPTSMLWQFAMCVRGYRDICTDCVHIDKCLDVSHGTLPE
jgi:hypothetical protein